MLEEISILTVIRHPQYKAVLARLEEAEVLLAKLDNRLDLILLEPCTIGFAIGAAHEGRSMIHQYFQSHPRHVKAT